MEDERDARPRYREGGRRIFDVFGIIAVGVMITSLWLLAMEHGSGFGELTSEITAEELEEGFREGYAYYGLYLGSGRVGSLYTDQRKDGDGYEMHSNMNLEIGSGFLKGHAKSELELHLDGEFRLRSFLLKLEGSGLEGEASGFWKGDALVISLALKGKPAITKRLDMPEPPLVQMSIRGALLRRGLKEGDRQTLSYFDPMRRSEIQTDIIYRGTRNIDLMGEAIEAHVFEEIIAGQRLVVHTNNLGEVLLEELPMGMVAVRESEIESTAFQKPGVSEKEPKIPSSDDKSSRPLWLKALLPNTSSSDSKSNEKP